MAIYERFAGGYVAERLRPVPGSEDAEQYEELAADPASGWRRVDDGPAPETDEQEGQEPPQGGGEGDGSGPGDARRPARSAVKAEWVAYARAVAESAEERNAIDGMTRDQLVEAYGQEGED